MDHKNFSSTCQAKTAALPFQAAFLDGQEYKLFRVESGVPIELAIQQATCFLIAAHRIGGNIVAKHDDEEDNHIKLHGVLYLIGMAKSLLQSAWSGIEKSQP